MATFQIMSKDDDDDVDSAYNSQTSNQGHSEPKSKKNKRQYDDISTGVTEHDEAINYGFDNYSSAASAQSTPESKPQINTKSFAYIPLSPRNKH